MEKYTCPCCGYKTLETEREYDICPICFWEDDLWHLEYPHKGGGTNRVSLIEGQRNFIEFGACEKEMITHVRKPNENDIKDSNWYLYEK